MKKRDTFLILFSLVTLLITAWFADWTGVYPYWRSALLAVGGYIILYLEALIHEGGHVLAGKRFGVRVAKLQFGVGLKVKRFTAARLDHAQITFCLLPFGGRVDFESLPISRAERIRILAAGVVCVLSAVPIAWFLIPSSVGWLRIEAVLIFCISSATNVFYSTSRKVCEEEGVYSDGQAIRGLLRYS
ncbi:site-2 protease family protein [Burkholderia sp. AU4i]|uniref:site-2 protease family protein n=1 Tax=Burkholderia sp. AU4i TaxID=1335308 RepID=UPI000688694F|nr:site-2 protease family protein [Burkholderia sp. AU4i]